MQRQPAKERTTIEKRKDAYSMLQPWSCRRVWCRGRVMRSMMNENQKSQSQVHVTALRCLRGKPGKRGFNSRLWPVLRGGGLVLTHYLITWLEMDGQHNTPRTARNFFNFPHDSSTPYNELYVIICYRGRRYSQVRFPAIHLVHKMLSLVVRY